MDNIRINETPTSTRQTVRCGSGLSHDYLMFCSHDYLGLSSHPDIAFALAEGVGLWAGGACSSPLISGYSLAHERLNIRLSTWYEKYIYECSTRTFVSSSLAKNSVISTLCDINTTIFISGNCHPSWLESISMTGSRVVYFDHADLDSLAQKMVAVNAKKKVVVCDSFFMFGNNIAPVRDIISLVDKCDATLVLDDSHGFGVVGYLGRGVLEAVGVPCGCVVLISSFSMAAGLCGAFVVGPSHFIHTLSISANSYVYSETLLSCVCYALQVSLDLIEGDVGIRRREKLRDLQSYLRNGLITQMTRRPELGWELSKYESHIETVRFAFNTRALALERLLESRKIRVATVPISIKRPGNLAIQIQLSSNHSVPNIAVLLAEIEAVL